MVGEIRDISTGGIAIKAALTGHLVLVDTPYQRLPGHDHAYDRHGVGAVQRGFSALNLISAQRLARRICTNCKVEASYDEEYLKAAKIDFDWVQLEHQLYKGEGLRPVRRLRLQGPVRLLRGHDHVDPAAEGDHGRDRDGRAA